MRKLCKIMCIIFLGNIILLSILLKENTQYKKEKKKLNFYLKKQEKYINNILEKDALEKGFRHDIRHHMNMLLGYINNRDFEAAREYILKINGAVEYTKREIYTGIAVVDAIIGDMYRNMDKNIEFKWDGIISNEKKIDVFDICTLFTNIMSNAIDACNKCTGKKYIKVKIYQYNDTIKIYEENTYNGNIKADKTGNLITSKKYGNNHGFGSRNIKRVVEKYDGIIKIFYDEKIFKLNITI